jgi:hypothetical protein
METNVGTADRTIRIALGLALLSLNVPSRRQCPLVGARWARAAGERIDPLVPALQALRNRHLRRQAMMTEAMHGAGWIFMIFFWTLIVLGIVALGKAAICPRPGQPGPVRGNSAGPFES